MNFRLFALVALVMPHVIAGTSSPDSSVQKSLIIAAIEGSTGIVEQLIEAGVNINDADENGKTALRWAAQGGHIEIAQMLIENGADVNHVDKYGNTVLGSTADVRLGKLLIENGANVYHVNGWRRTTALLDATELGRVGIARLLIQNGAYVNYSDTFGATPLRRAAGAGLFEIVQLLIDNGANVNHVDNKGESALMYAAQGGYVEIGELLTKHDANVNLAHIRGGTALTSAARNGHATMAQLLIENGAIVNHVDIFGNTALIYAVFGGHVETVQLLIKHGTNVNLVDTRGQTALMGAAMGGHVTMAQLLIEHGADVDLTVPTGRTALSFATSYGQSPHRQDLCRLLILAGAEINGVHSEYRSICVDPIISPLTAIRNSVRSQQTLDAILTPLRAIGISPIQGLISFAFESLKNGVDIFSDSNIISFLRDQEWGQNKLQGLESIVKHLIRFQCTDLNVLHIVAPFISTADDDTLRRFEVSLRYLVNVIPKFGRSSVASNGRLLNAMIHRSAHLGFRPVLKALYSIYWNFVQVQRALHSSVPEDAVNVIEAFTQDIERDAMVKLAKAIKRHHEALGSTHSTEQGTITSTTTDVHTSTSTEP
jgi:ankyrin repeat protein